MTADILERLDFMLISRRSDEDAIIRDARAEIVRLRGEVEALLEDPDEAELAYRCGDPDSDAIAPAEANGDLSALERLAWNWKNIDVPLGDVGSSATLERCANELRAVIATMTTPQPAAGEAVAYSVVQVGNRGAAYDPPNTHRAFTYEHQPGNIDASRLGRATNAAAVASAGDSIDRGLSLLKELQAIGFGVFQIGPPAPMQAAQQEGEVPQLVRYGRGSTESPYLLDQRDDGYWTPWHVAQRELARALAAHPSAYELGAWNDAIEAAASEAEHWQARSGSTHKCGDYIAGAIRSMKRAALQHRGDSQEVGRG